MARLVLGRLAVVGIGWLVARNILLPTMSPDFGYPLFAVLTTVTTVPSEEWAILPPTQSAVSSLATTKHKNSTLSSGSSINNSNSNNDRHNISVNPKTNETDQLCLRPFFVGNEFNRILQVVNSFQIAADRGKELVLPKKPWAQWFDSWFSPQETPFFSFQTTSRPKCRQLTLIKPLDAHYYGRCNTTLANLVRLRPKESIRNQAKEAVQKLLQHNLGNTTSFVSVHRRSMDQPDNSDACYYTASTNGECTYCFSPNVTVEEQGKYCTITHQDVLEDLRKRDAEFGTSFASLPVVLFTDGQDVQRDKTFPYIDTNDFRVQSWMMVLSAVHYGNPLSTVDYVVSHWRKGREMRPAACYGGFDEAMRSVSAVHESTKW